MSCLNKRKRKGVGSVSQRPCPSNLYGHSQRSGMPLGQTLSAAYELALCSDLQCQTSESVKRVSVGLYLADRSSANALISASVNFF